MVGAGGEGGACPSEVHGWGPKAVPRVGSSAHSSEPTLAEVILQPSPLPGPVSGRLDIIFYIFQQLKGKLS